MSITENVLLALVSLKANKMRALLTMLGIIIGIGAVIAIVTIGDSLTGAFNEEMASFGARNVTVSVRQKGDPSFNVDPMAAAEADAAEPAADFEYKTPAQLDKITDEMVREYRKKFASQLASLAASDALGSVKLTNGRFRADAALMGASADQAVIDKLTMLAGRFITDADSTEKRAVAVVSDQFVKNYFGGRKTPEQALGQTVETQAEGKPLRLYIAGVYQYKKPDGMFGGAKSSETNLYLPIATGRKLLEKPGGYTTLTLQSRKDVDGKAFQRLTGQFFESFYTRNPTFTASATSMAEMMKSMDKMNQTIKLGISGIAAISLLVGGIGVMNIMMVSVTERTREIGVRMALGAKSRVILFQFIVEAVIICLIGGLIGVGAGVGLGSIGAMLMKHAARPNPVAAMAAVAFSMGIGVFFGYYPAKRAARLDPIEALRYE